MHYLLAAILFLAPHIGRPTAKKYTRIIRTEATRGDVDPLLVVSFIHVETVKRWDPRTKSVTNDYGLCQVHVAARGSDRFLGREEELYKPKVNVREWVRLANMWRNYHRKNCEVWHQICYSGPEGPWGCSNERIAESSHPWWAHLKWGYKVKNTKHADKVGALYKSLVKRFRSNETKEVACSVPQS